MTQRSDVDELQKELKQAKAALQEAINELRAAEAKVEEMRRWCDRVYKNLFEAMEGEND